MKRFFLSALVLASVLSFASAQNAHIIKEKITSSSQLLSRFKGKVVFLDLWATWCDPCKEEFVHSDILYKELTKRNIVLLYVSLHSNVDTLEWKSDIDKYHLNGEHILASKELENSLEAMIWGHPGGVSIPRYLLIGSDGKVLLIDALSPGHGSGLYAQIDNALKR